MYMYEYVSSSSSCRVIDTYDAADNNNNNNNDDDDDTRAWASFASAVACPLQLLGGLLFDSIRF